MQAPKFFQVKVDSDTTFYHTRGGPFSIKLNDKTVFDGAALYVRVADGPEVEEAHFEVELNEEMTFIEGKAPPASQILLSVIKGTKQTSISGRVLI